MIIGRKSTVYIMGGILGLAIIFLAVKLIFGNSYKNKIPALPDFQNLSKPLQDQLAQAYNKAHQKPTATNLGMLGMVYHSSMFYDKAAVCYELAIEENKEEWLWSYYLGYLKRETGESNAAIENFQNVTRINHKMNLAIYYTGDAYQNLGKNDLAESLFSSLRGTDNLTSAEDKKSDTDDFPIGIYAGFQLSRIYIGTQRLILAEKTLNEIIQAGRSFGPAYRLLGNLYKMKGDSVLGGEYILQADDLTDNSTPVDKLIDGISLLSRSDQYLLKQIDVAEKSAHPLFALVIADHALKYNPGNRFLTSKAVKLLLNMNYGNQALPYLDLHLKLFTDDFKEIKEVANLLYNRGLYSQSFTYYQRASELKHEDNEVQSSLVLCLWREGKKDLALEKMNSLVVNNKENLKILADGVYVMLVLGEKDKAVSYLQKLVELAPADSRVHLMQGMVDEMSGKPLEALSMYRLSFKSNPKDMAVVQALGNSLVNQKMWPAAIDHYRKAILSFPNEPFLLEKLGSLLIGCPDQKLRKNEEGRKLEERVFIHKASTPDLTISSGQNIAMSYASEGDYKKAYAYIEWVSNIARAQKAPAKIVADLENLLKQYNDRK
jgi:tetratricopeptide (TPR) repeat protein